MEEARFSYTTKNQRGDLITARGDTWSEFADHVTLVDQLAHGSAVERIQTAMPGSQVIADQELPTSMNPQCKDCGGPTRYEEWTGKNGKNAGKQFKAFKCMNDKDHRPEWVN